ncbi:hypothetical protein KPC_3786 [Acinetobacter stercoris]|uniref:Uncharacterized protein n=1 Tax=Acinetobacter stercoris TaxID=2126983 RepID=A0A2U3N4K3_9GAMM|nr:hypothetical protein KPC_3786 [Acinetobacter stercoris]
MTTAADATELEPKATAPFKPEPTVALSPNDKALFEETLAFEPIAMDELPATEILSPNAIFEVFAIVLLTPIAIPFDTSLVVKVVPVPILILFVAVVPDRLPTPITPLFTSSLPPNVKLVAPLPPVFP